MGVVVPPVSGGGEGGVAMKLDAISMLRSSAPMPGAPLFVVLSATGAAPAMSVDIWLTPDEADQWAADIRAAAARARKRIHDPTGAVIP